MLLVFIRDNFLIFFLCAFWRLRLDPLQMQRGAGQWRNGKVPAARHASPHEDYNTRINSEIERERERGCASQVSMNTRLSECGCKCVSTLKACSCTFVILSKGVLHFFELMFTCLLLVCVCVKQSVCVRSMNCETVLLLSYVAYELSNTATASGD